jgi:hypothetical protein
MISVAYPGYCQEPPARPVVVTVIGILAIVAGGFILLSLPFSLLQVSGVFAMGGPGAQIMQDPTFRTWTIVSTTINALLAIPDIVAGIGLLAMRRWAWLLAIALVIASALSAIVGVTAMQALDIMGKMGASMGAGDPAMAAMMQRFTTVAMLAGIIFWLAAYAAVIVLLTLPNVRRAFAKR